MCRADQIIQFARAVGLGVALASYGELEDVLLKANVGQPDVLRPHRAGQSSYPSRCGSTVMESVASRSSYFLPTITEASEHVVVVVGSEDDANDHEQWGVCGPQGASEERWSLEKMVPEDLLTFGQLKAKIVATQKKVNKSKIRFSRVGRPNPVTDGSSKKGGWVFAEEMLERAPFAKVFATRPDDLLHNKHCFYCMFCKQNVNIAFRGISELKRHFQREHHLRLDQRYRESHFPKSVCGSDARCSCAVW